MRLQSTPCNSCAPLPCSACAQPLSSSRCMRTHQKWSEQPGKQHAGRLGGRRAWRQGCCRRRTAAATPTHGRVPASGLALRKGGPRAPPSGVFINEAAAAAAVGGGTARRGRRRRRRTVRAAAVAARAASLRSPQADWRLAVGAGTTRVGENSGEVAAVVAVEATATGSGVEASVGATPWGFNDGGGGVTVTVAPDRRCGHAASSPEDIRPIAELPDSNRTLGGGVCRPTRSSRLSREPPASKQDASPSQAPGTPPSP